MGVLARGEGSKVRAGLEGLGQTGGGSEGLKGPAAMPVTRGCVHRKGRVESSDMHACTCTYVQLKHAAVCFL